MPENRADAEIRDDRQLQVVAKDRLNIGVLGAGPIAQFAHLESCQKAANANLFAICDVADDLLARVSAYYAPEKIYTDYAAMLDDASLDAVIVATADAYHVPMAIEALEAEPGSVALLWTHAAHAVNPRQEGSDTRWCVVYGYRNPGADSKARRITPEFENRYEGAEGLLSLY